MSAGIANNKIPEFRRALRKEQERRLTRAAIIVNRTAKELLSVSGTGVRGPSGKMVRAVKRTRKTFYGAFPSRPGEPPRKQTGRLRGSVAWELISGLAARVGTNVKYGRYLQLGTSRMGKRPWLDVALKRSVPQITSIMNAPWRWEGTI